MNYYNDWSISISFSNFHKTGIKLFIVPETSGQMRVIKKLMECGGERKIYFSAKDLKFLDTCLITHFNKPEDSSRAVTSRKWLLYQSKLAFQLHFPLLFKSYHINDFGHDNHGISVRTTQLICYGKWLKQCNSTPAYKANSLKWYIQIDWWS